MGYTDICIHNKKCDAASSQKGRDPTPIVRHTHGDQHWQTWNRKKVMIFLAPFRTNTCIPFHWFMGNLNIHVICDKSHGNPMAFMDSMEIMWLSEFTTHPQRSSYMHRKTNTFLSPKKSTKFTHPPKKSSFHHYHLLLQVTYLSTEKHHFATISPSRIVRNPQLHPIKYWLVQNRISITDDANFPNWLDRVLGVLPQIRNGL